ncbi:hypothetical protein K9N68_08600 [Kovacikia minuta CCNUW1]|uniref:hypothetical protein n=1 Tax=Kovacikia minuta TaxID=2931930 RepID=UPI001CCCFF2B|nr:hypothetical protein [Kovacikia minuta]UBF27940.1 hypothetical protein K9N68_08600 [Kovacikia minuta CCNUW1]
MTNSHSNQDLFALFEEVQKESTLLDSPYAAPNVPPPNPVTPMQNYDSNWNPDLTAGVSQGGMATGNGNGYRTNGNGNGSSYANGQAASSQPETAVQKAVVAIQALRKEVEKSQNAIKTEMTRAGTASNPVIAENLSQLDKLPPLLEQLGQFVQQQFQGQLPVAMQQQIAANREWLGEIAQQMQQAETQDDLFSLIVSEVRNQLQVDRVIIFNFDTGKQGHGAGGIPCFRLDSHVG